MFTTLAFIALGALIGLMLRPSYTQTKAEWEAERQANERGRASRRKAKLATRVQPVQPVKSSDLTTCQALGPYTGKTPYIWLALVGILFIAGLVIACLN